ncbi:hypothetical protein BC628DRAFT_1153340 [Trametes gibbosa]|nr:hypothetical protein BC628DRAFT_1153340 [Trametes gibbosa]
MSRQQHAAIVVLESIRVLTVDTAGARSLTRDANPANVSGQGHAIQYSIAGAVITLTAWINAVSEVGHAPFEDNVALKVIADLTACVHAYTDLMAALVEKHDVLTAPSSPLAPDGVIIGGAINAFQFVLAIYLLWLRGLVPTRRAELNAQAKLTQEAFRLAAERYPPQPDDLAGAKAFEAVCGKRLLPEPPTGK